MRVYVTGATGFIGRRIVDALLGSGHTVVALTRRPEVVAPREGVEVRKCDLMQLEQVLPAIQDCEAGIHTAGAGPGATEAELFAANVQAARHVAGSARRFKRLSRLVAFTSSAVEEPGDTPYRRAKLGQEAALRIYQLDLTVLRPTLVLGPFEESEDLKRLVARLRDDKPFPLIGGGRIRIQPTFVDDVARAAVAAVERKESIGKFFTLAGPEGGIPWCEFVAEVKRRVGGKAPLRSLPRIPLKVAGTLAALAGGGQRLRAALTYYGQDHCYDLAPAREILGFEPQPYAVALDRAFGPALEPAAAAGR